MVRPDPKTLNELFNSAADRFRDQEFLRFKTKGEWHSLSFVDLASRVRELALGLHALGIRRGDRIAIWSENRPEWNLADLASLACGAVDVPIYATQAPSQVEYILRDSGARAIFVSSAFAEDAVRIMNNLPALKFVISLDEMSHAAIPIQVLIDKGRALYAERPDLYERLWRGAAADDLATILYTSGSTGDPKGVMLTHKNLTANVLNSQRWLDLDDRREIALTYLPFSHIFERAAWYLYTNIGAVIAYAESIEAVARNLLEVRPTAMTSVPRMFEKIYAKIIERGLSAGFPKRQIFLWALAVGRRWAEAKDRGDRVGPLLALQHKIADALVFKKWREAVGGNV